MNDKLIQIGGKSYKQCDVVMLPTEKASKITFLENKLMHSGNVNWQSKQHDWEEGDGINQNLYILSDEEIKEGDWVYDVKNNQIDRYTSSSIKEEIKYFKKIISTTDKDIFLSNFHYRYSYPRPSDDFIKAFVKAQGKIDKVLVQYEYKGKEYVDEQDGIGYDKVVLKVAPDNTITIKPIQEEKTSWTEEKVLDFVCAYSGMEKSKVKRQLDKWLENGTL